MFSEIREVRRNEKIKSERERELDTLRMQMIDCRIGSDEFVRLMEQIKTIEASMA